MTKQKLFIWIFVAAMAITGSGCDGPASSLDMDGDTSGGDDDNGDGGNGSFCDITADCQPGCYCQMNECICADDDDDDDISNDDDDDTGNDPCAIVSPSEVDFGAVLMDRSAQASVTIENGCKGTLEISGALFSQNEECPNTLIATEYGFLGTVPDENNVVRLAGGEKHQLVITYTPEDPGKDCGWLLVSTNADLLQIPIGSRLKGYIGPSLECDAAEGVPLDENNEVRHGQFGLVPVGAPPKTLTCRFQNEPNDDGSNRVMIVTDIELSDPFHLDFMLDHNSISYNNLREVWLSPRGSEDFKVLFAPRSQGLTEVEVCGVFNDDANNPDDTNAPTSPLCHLLQGSGAVPELVVEPNPINFGFVEAGETSTITVKLMNRGGTTLRIDGATFETATVAAQVFGETPNYDPDYDGTANIPADVDTWSEATIQVSCSPVDRTASVGTLGIESDSRTADYLPVPMTCTGIVAELHLAPRSLDFGCVRAGNMSEFLRVSVSNTGQAALTIDEGQFTGAPIFYADLGGISPGTQLFGGETINVDIYCQPDAGMDGTYTGTYNILTNGGQDVQSVQLSCCAMSPCAEYSPSVVEFVDVQKAPEGLDPNLPEADQWRECTTIDISNDCSQKLTISSIETYSSMLGSPEDQFELNLDRLGSLPIQIYPGNSKSFDVCYLPTRIGAPSDAVIVCSDANNASGASVNCQTDGHSPSQINIYANSINPSLCVDPIFGELDWGYMLPGETETKRITIQNCGTGSLIVSNIDFNSITMQDFKPFAAIVPDTFPITLTENPNDYITVDVKFSPTDVGLKSGAVQIHHNDKDAARVGAPPGNDKDIFQVYLSGGSAENKAPKAIVKSPMDTPDGPYGSRSRIIEAGTTINLGGSWSYDPDDGSWIINGDDEWEWQDDTQVQDNIEQYVWSCPGCPVGFQWVGGTNVPQTQARFDQAGTYHIKLEVKDSRDEWSIQTMDSMIEVKVMQRPFCIAHECNTFQTSIETDTDMSICFDARDSVDSDGTIQEYRWYLRRLGETSETNIGLASVINYSFPDAGDYVVRLEVVDDEGNESEELPACEVEVNASNNDRIRVELTWTGQGDVDLHWIRPGGMINTPGDCYKNNPLANWTSSGYGRPTFEQESSDGLSPEVCRHDDPGNGTYKASAYYETPSETCGYGEPTCIDYTQNCDQCGCKDSFLCMLSFCGIAGLIGSCCNDCQSCEPQWECNPNPGQATFRFFINDAPYPKFTVSGANTVLQDERDIVTVSITRDEGKFLPP